MSIASPAHILIIDDQPQSLGSLTTLLRATGWRISIATRGKQGFHRAQVLQPDLILLDVFMPEMDGFAVCRLLQESPRTCDVPVIFLTSAEADSERLQGLETGSVDYVAKTCQPAEVVARIRIHLRWRDRTATHAVATPMPLLSQGEIELRAAMRVISENLATVPSLDELAQRAGTHRKKLSTIFREHLGMTVFAWIREERLRMAREWLTTSEASVQDIAAEVGFHSDANFATAFRKRMGVTPSQYRANRRHTGVQDSNAP